MGRGEYSRNGKKWTTDDFRSVSIPELKKQKALDCGTHGWNWRQNWGEKKIVASISYTVSTNDITFNYHTKNRDGGMLPVNQLVVLGSTPCNYGGARIWFHCGCGHRVSRLFLTPTRVACRHCLNLTYSSQMENASDRTWRRRDRFLEKLGGDLIYMDIKPKYMHWRTWERLRQMCIRENMLALGAGMYEMWD